jgi:PTH2 family peptidyl-tRNA hydrolase
MTYIELRFINPKMSEYAMYIIVNSGLKMRKGKIAAQVAHSACNAIRVFERGSRKDQYYNVWLRDGEPKIVLKAKEKEMLNLIDKYELYKKVKVNTSEDAWCVYTRDYGLTQIAPDSLTTIAFRPMPKSKVPKEIKKFKLL